MFEKILFSHRRILGPAEPINLGALAEALIFYNQVNVVASHGVLRQLIFSLGPEVLLEFLENEFMTISYHAGQLGTHTSAPRPGLELHAPIMVTGEFHNMEEFTAKLLFELTGRRGHSNRFAKRLSGKIQPVSFENSVFEDIKLDFDDSDYVEKSAIELIRFYVPEYPNPDNIKFRLHREKDKFRVNSDINFPLLNKFFHLRVPKEHSTITPATFLSHLFNIRGDIFFCSLFQSEIATDSANSPGVSLKFSELLNKNIPQAESSAKFQDFVFEDARAISEAINNDSRSFSDLLALREKAQKFRIWLHNQDPEKDLLREYFRAVTAESWVDKLPPKGIRWVLFLGLGAAADAAFAGGIGTAFGATISAADSFLLDKVLKGWKPNQFVDRDLRKFVNK